MKITPPNITTPASAASGGGGGGGGGGGSGGPAGGDLGNNLPNPTVTGFQGRPLCVDAPAINDVYTWDGTEWCPAPGGGGSSLPWFVVTDYGAVNDGSTNDTAAINLAIAALNAAGHGVLYFPGGDGYQCTGALTTITVPFLVLGDGSAADDSGSGNSTIYCSSATAALFTVTPDVGRFEKIGLINNAGGTPSAGGGVIVAGAASFQRVDFEGVSIGGFWINFDIQVGDLWTMHACFSVGPVKYGIKIQNTVANDNGDWSISDCSIFSQTYSADAGIKITSSGGGKIANLKINAASGSGAGPKFVNAIDLSGSSTSIFMVTNTSIENYTGDGIHVNGGGAMQVYHGLQFGQYGNGTGNAFDIASTTDVIIDDCAFIADTGTPTAILLTTVTRAALGRFTNNGFGTLVSSSGSTLLDATGGIGSSVFVTGTPSSGQVPTATSGTAATWQTPSSAPSGAAGGDLSGTYPNPGVAKINGVAVTGTPSTGQVITATSSTTADWETPAAVGPQHVHVDNVVFSGDAATTAFVLPAAPVDAYSVSVYVTAARSQDWTLSGTLLDTLTFGTPPPAVANNIVVDIVAALA